MAVVLVLKNIKLGDQLLHPYSLMLSNSIMKATSRIPCLKLASVWLKTLSRSKESNMLPRCILHFSSFRSDITFLKDDPMHEWKPHWSEYLDELLFLDGFRGFSNDRCPMCIVHSNNNPPLYRCLDCFIGQPVCGECCLLAHTLHLLHIIEVVFFCDAVLLHLRFCSLQRWNNNFFECTSLKSLGLRVQLGHPIGGTCTNPRTNAKSFFVLHINSIHEVAVDFCNCDRKCDAGNWRVQCLRREWFPATQKNPEMCFMFHLMEHFHLHTLQAKTMAHDYCIALAKLTDNTATFKPLVSMSLFQSPFLLTL